MKFFKFNQIAMFCIFTGMLSYIFVDSGLYEKISNRFQTTSSTEPNNSPLDNNITEVIAQSTQIKSNLDKLESDFFKERKYLSELKKQSESLQDNINQRKTELSLIEKKISQLSKNSALTPSVSTRSVASEKTIETKEQIEQKMSRLEKDLNHLSGIDTEVVSIQHKNRDYIRVKTTIDYTDTGATYLTDSGLRQVTQIIRGFRLMGYKNIYFAHNDQSELTRERIRSVTSYVKNLYRKKIKTSRLNVNADIDFKDSFEIWATRGQF